MWSNNSAEITPGGLLLIDKPKDFSSHDVVAVARRALKIKKIGHSGTLDPMATGLLILLVGREATKQQDRFLKLSKTYSATLTLGQETDSWDACGRITAEVPVSELTQKTVEQAAKKLSGEIEQPIPFFSAKKVQGRPMYSLARQGQTIARKYSKITVAWTHICLRAPDTIDFTVHCSCGTYVRALGYLLARQLGTVGHLTMLRRLSIGEYKVDNAFDGAKLKQTPAEQLYERIVAV